MSTIVAISSPVGAGGIGIVRVSGKDALDIAGAIFVFASKKDATKASDWVPLHMNFGTFSASDFSDKGYAVFFPAAKAFTGEDTIEFYLHGGVRVLNGAVEEILKHGAVLAERGEFTKRAFLAGKMNLSDAEGVIDMINAESAAAIRAAYRQMNGGLSEKINRISEILLDNIVSLEASLDYPDEMEDEVIKPLEIGLNRAINEISALLLTVRSGKMAKHGVNAVLAGATNAGKSSLLNAFLNEDRAIVTPVAGTTRDVITESVECKGVKINLVDTAGLRESEDFIESAGIARAKKAIEGADVVLHVVDAKRFSENKSLSFDTEIQFDDKNQTKLYTVFNKCDEISEQDLEKLKNKSCGLVEKYDKEKCEICFVSAKTGDGVQALLEKIADLFIKGETDGGEIITSERHLSALLEAKTALVSARAAFEKGESTDCVLIDLRSAYDALGKITGKTATEDIVNGIFFKFCVGK